MSDVAQERTDDYLDGIDAAADWQPVSGDKLVELVGPTFAAIIEANYQRRLKEHEAMVERHRRAVEEWQRRTKADEDWMKANGFWPVWPEDEDEVTQ